jgi:hypothetical protein
MGIRVESTDARDNKDEAEVKAETKNILSLRLASSTNPG